jgi:AraC-like DNA-binding protein
MPQRADRRANPAYELINPLEHSSILYRQHGFPHPLVRWHYHREYELHLITHSAGKVFVGDYIGNFYPGHLILTGPNLPHNWISQTDNGETFDERDRVVTFTDELIQSARTVFPEITALDVLLEHSRFGIEFQGATLIREAQALMQEIAQAEGLKRLAAFLSLMSLLAETEQYQLLSSDQYHTVSGEKNQHRVNLAVNYIVEHYNRDLGLEEVAEHLAMQPTYFSKFFRQATGRRFIEFINSLRITRACDLLAHSSLPITDICFEVGFCNISNFNRRFHALKGMTPSDYRKLAPVVSTLSSPAPPAANP